jgi:prepilin signal peptidase PulO-like enzyme (type II secretory pathway)
MTSMSLMLIIPLFVGWAVGLIVNYFSDVLPLTRSFSQPTCPVCNQQYGAKKYLLLSTCPNGHKRSTRTWIVQLVGVAGSIFIWIMPPESLGYFFGIILFGYFCVVFVIDLEHRLILHPTSLVGVLIGIVFGTLKHGLGSTLSGAVAGLLIMLVLYYLGVLFARYRAKRMAVAGSDPDDEEALGAGDVILVTILGLIVGWPFILLNLLYAILLGGAVSSLILLWLIVTRKYSQNALMVFTPYGPYLITIAFLIVFIPKFLKNVIPGQ